MGLLKELLALPTATVGDLLVSGAVVVMLISAVVIGVTVGVFLVVEIVRLVARKLAWRRLCRRARLVR